MGEWLMANSNIQLFKLSLKKKKHKNWVIDFLKSWVQKYMVRNAIMKDVVSLYTDLYQGSTRVQLGSKELYLKPSSHAKGAICV